MKRHGMDTSGTLAAAGSEHQKRKEAIVLGFHQLDLIWEHSPILPPLK